MPKRRTLMLLALAVLLAAALAAWLFSRAPVVSTVVLQAAPLTQTLQFSARVATAARVDVGSTLTGRVREVLVDEGATVRAGQALLRLDTDELQASLAQAEAAERQAAARLAGLRSSGRGAASAAVAQAQSVQVAAQAELQRTQALVAQGFLSPARLDEAQRALAVAQAQLDSARAQQAANAEAGTDIAQAQAQLAQAGATRAAAQARLGQAVVLAPVDARVLSRAVEPGQIVQPGKALMTLALAGPLQLEAQVDERYLGQLQAGQRASVRADAYPEQALSARVQRIAPLVDAQRGAVEVKLALEPPLPGFLREDMSVSVAVQTAQRERALVLPLAALRGDEARPVVWLVQDQRVVERPVRLGLRTLDSAELLQGAQAGDQVLLGPSPAPGSSVRVQAHPAAAAAPQTAPAR